MPEPTVDIASYYNNGMSWDEFVEDAAKNAGRMRDFFDGFEFDEETLAFYNGLTPLQVLAIAEDWCPDVVHNLAAIARISDEVPGMELSIVRRDENPELMDDYVTGGKRRIPVIAFFDMTFRELGRWAGRCRSADEWIFGEILKGGVWGDLSNEEIIAFNAEYDRRYRDTYLQATLSEWEHLLSDQDF